MKNGKHSAYLEIANRPKSKEIAKNIERQCINKANRRLNKFLNGDSSLKQKEIFLKNHIKKCRDFEWEIYFYDSNFSNLNISGLDLSHAIFNRVNMMNVRSDAKTNVTGTTMMAVNISGSDITQIDSSKIKLIKCTIAIETTGIEKIIDKDTNSEEPTKGKDRYVIQTIERLKELTKPTTLQTQELKTIEQFHESKDQEQKKTLSDKIEEAKKNPKYFNEAFNTYCDLAGITGSSKLNFQKHLKAEKQKILGCKQESKEELSNVKKLENQDKKPDIKGKGSYPPR